MRTVSKLLSVTAVVMVLWPAISSAQIGSLQTEVAAKRNTMTIEQQQVSPTPAAMIGKITSINGRSFTIVTGQHRTTVYAEEGTMIRKGGADIQMVDLRVGAPVEVSGVWDRSGMIIARQVNVLPSPTRYHRHPTSTPSSTQS